MYYKPIYIWKIKYKDNGYYVIFDCFNKGDKECSTRDSWLSNFDLYIKKLEPNLECRKFLTVFHDARVETDPGLLALAYAVSILEGINPALREFEDSENMIAHYNKCLKKRFFEMFPVKKITSEKKAKFTEPRFKDM